MAKVEKVLEKIEKRLSAIEKNQKKLLAVENTIEKEEEQELTGESEELSTQKKEMDELKELEKIEHNIEKSVKINPLTRVTLKDFSKAIIGAFIGIIGHFSFFYGIEIAEHISVVRAIVLYIASFLIGMIYLYFAGFRKVVDMDIAKFVPVRLAVIYITAIAVIVIVLYLFGFITTHTTFLEIFKSVSTISILAVLGATTADLIGGKE
ncbi:hypothetical protein C4573_02810 [Candidatus Woesearchaeota archaeon]|nr:MAG: hypothetical protein C4573_02810 [Candidatus Woesearchaeota archaeon]